ncbi:MAG: PhzF family phenazine biosynthesis protein [bacterium]
MHGGRLHRVTAFATLPTGGNPAGVWVGDAFPSDTEMQQIAADVGYSETAFVVPATGLHRRVRYFSPEAEVSFCGHATIASGVVLGNTEGDGQYVFHTAVGAVPVAVGLADGMREAALTSVTPRHEPASDALLTSVLAALGWRRDEVDEAVPPARIYAGAWHLVIATRTRETLAHLAYDFATLKQLMITDGLTTLQLIWRDPDGAIHSRNPFPVGGVVEDPATGASAAALGGYLRDIGLVRAPAHLVIRQGEDMGRPSRILVEVPTAGGIVVRGTAVSVETR